VRLLLDTQVWVWMRSAPNRLTARARRVAIGKLRLPCSVEEFVSTRSLATRVVPLPITQLHAIESAALPLHHRDPFDRVLVAQARLEGVPLLTTDDAFAAYDVERIRAN